MFKNVTPFNTYQILTEIDYANLRPGPIFSLLLDWFNLTVPVITTMVIATAAVITDYPSGL